MNKIRNIVFGLAILIVISGCLSEPAPKQNMTPPAPTPTIMQAHTPETTAVPTSAIPVPTPTPPELKRAIFMSTGNEKYIGASISRLYLGDYDGKMVEFSGEVLGRKTTTIQDVDGVKYNVIGFQMGGITSAGQIIYIESLVFEGSDRIQENVRVKVRGYVPADREKMKNSFGEELRGRPMIIAHSIEILPPGK